MEDDLHEQQEQIESAAGSVHFWNNQRLQPYSFEREMCYYRCKMDDSGREASTFIVFLCTLGEEVEETIKDRNGNDVRLTGLNLMEMARGESGIPDFIRRFNKWGEKHRLNPNSPEGLAAQQIGVKIYKEAEASRFKTVREGTAPPNA